MFSVVVYGEACIYSKRCRQSSLLKSLKNFKLNCRSADNWKRLGIFDWYSEVAADIYHIKNLPFFLSQRRRMTARCRIFSWTRTRNLTAGIGWGESVLDDNILVGSWFLFSFWIQFGRVRCKKREKVWGPKLSLSFSQRYHLASSSVSVAGHDVDCWESSFNSGLSGLRIDATSSDKERAARSPYVTTVVGAKKPF